MVDCTYPSFVDQLGLQQHYFFAWSSLRVVTPVRTSSADLKGNPSPMLPHFLVCAGNILLDQLHHFCTISMESHFQSASFPRCLVHTSVTWSPRDQGTIIWIFIYEWISVHQAPKKTKHSYHRTFSAFPWSQSTCSAGGFSWVVRKSKELEC